MRVSLVEPLTTAAQIRVFYNDTELLTKDYQAGETPDLEFETPQESGRAKPFLLIEGAEIPLGSASYYFDDIKGAEMLMEDADALSQAGKSWQARTKLLKAIALLETLSPASEQMAQAYVAMCFAYWNARCRRSHRRQRQYEAVAWYEKALSVWEANGNFNELACNLTNISSMYRRIDDLPTALICARRGLELEIAYPTPVDSAAYEERPAAWSHAASCLLAIGELNEAEAVIKDGLERLGDMPNCGYLWGLWAQVHEARAQLCRQTADKILPADRCSI